jgi:apolipoprotein N-acyltransferase
VVTTSGVSGLINADGSTAFTLPEHVGASGVVTLPQREGVTPATWLGGWIELAVVLMAALGLGAALAYGRMARDVPDTGEENGRPGSLA